VNKEQIARVLSFILGPQIWFPVLILLFLFKTGLTQQQIFILFPIVLFFQILLPFGVLFWFVKTKRISDWDIRIRKERYKILPIFIVSNFIALILIYYFGTPLFFHLYLIFWLVALLGVLITFFWKISLHVMLNTSATIIVNLLFMWSLPFFYLLIPIVGWARYYQKHHTISQILGGVVLSCIVTITLLYFFGYIAFR